MNDQFDVLVNNLTRTLSDIGLEVRHLVVQGDADPEAAGSPDFNLRDAIERGTSVYVNASFEVLPSAWHDRNLRPEKYKEDTEFELMMPDEIDMAEVDNEEAARLLRELREDGF